MLGQGLGLSLIGLCVTFAALGLLILAMVFLERLFRTRPLVAHKDEPEETPVTNSLARDTGDEEVAAAIVTALAYLRSMDICRSGLGASLEAGHGAWWMMGGLQQRSGGEQRSEKRGLP